MIERIRHTLPVLVAVMLGLAFPLTASRIGAAQPNGTECVQGTSDGCPIYFNQYTQATMPPGENTHIWRISAPASGRFSVQIRSANCKGCPTRPGVIQGADLDIYVYDSDGKLVGSDEGDGFLSFADVDGMRPDQYSIFVNVNDSRDRGQGIVSYVLVVFASIDILSAMPSRGFENIIACDLNPILRVEFSSSGQNIGIHGFSDSIWSISKELRQKMPTNRSAVYWFSQDLNDAISITYTYRDRALASRVSLMRTVDLGERLILDESDKHTSYADFSPDKAYIAGRRSGSVPVWRSGDGSLLAEYEFPNGSNTRVRFSPDGQTLAAHGSAEIRLWRVSDGAVLMTFGGTQKIWDFAFSPMVS